MDDHQYSSASGEGSHEVSINFNILTVRSYSHALRSNHGSFYYNQLASLQVLVDDLTGANETLQEYFTGIYMGQINSTGDQVGSTKYIPHSLRLIFHRSLWSLSAQGPTTTAHTTSPP